MYAHITINELLRPCWVKVLCNWPQPVKTKRFEIAEHRFPEWEHEVMTALLNLRLEVLINVRHRLPATAVN